MSTPADGDREGFRDLAGSRVSEDDYEALRGLPQPDDADGRRRRPYGNTGLDTGEYDGLNADQRLIFRAMKARPDGRPVEEAELVGAYRKKVAVSIGYGYGYGNIPGRGSFRTDGYGLAEEHPLYRASDAGALLTPRQTSFGIPGTQADAKKDWIEASGGWISPEGFNVYSRTGMPDGRPREREADPNKTRQALEDALDPLSIEEAQATPRRGNRSEETKERLRYIDGAITHVAQHHDREVIGEIMNLSPRTIYVIARRSGF